MKYRLQDSKHRIKLLELQLQDSSLGPKRSPEFPTHSLTCLVTYLNHLIKKKKKQSCNMEAYISVANPVKLNPIPV